MRQAKPLFADISEVPVSAGPFANYGQHTPAAAKPAPPPIPPAPFFKVIDLGEVSPEKLASIMESVSKAWGIEMAPLLKPTSFKDQLKSDFTNAAYRVGSTQLLNATKNFLVQYARKSCNEEGKIRAIAELLDTEIGTALMAMFIGMAVSQIPQMANNPRMQRILKEFRVGGMASIGNSAVEALISSMIPVISSALQNIEKTESIQTEDNSLSALEEEIIINSESNTVAPLLRQS